jgi:TolB protein
MLVLSLNACSVKEESKVTTEELGGAITVVDNGDKKTQEPVVSVEKIERLERFENIEISDWLDEETVIVSKDNDTLGKMTLSEFPDTYPRSLYFYNIKTKEYKLIKEQKNVFLGGATLSADKKYLLYSEYVLGDPSYYVMNLDTKDTFCIMGDDISSAKSAGWFGNEVAGAAYNNGAYLASASGDISVLEGLKDESVFILRVTKDNVYYNTGNDASLIKMNRTTKEKTDLNLKNVFNVILSYDGTKMLVLQSDTTKSTLLLCDLDGSNLMKIVEGTDISGISWSADQRMIAYNVKSTGTNAKVNGLYVYDMLTAKANQVVVDIQNAFTNLSPLGDKLVYTQWNGEEYDSSIVYLKSSIHK